jgi:hypothetical protein
LTPSKYTTTTDGGSSNLYVVVHLSDFRQDKVVLVDDADSRCSLQPPPNVANAIHFVGAILPEPRTSIQRFRDTDLSAIQAIQHIGRRS